MSREFSDMDDKEFDDFLKEVSESPDIPFREEDWELMKARLAAPSVQPSPSKWGTGLAWLGILSILLLGIYFGGNALWKTGSLDQQQEIGTQDLQAESERTDMGSSNLAEIIPSEEEKESPKSTSAKAESNPLTSSVSNLELEDWRSEASIFSDSRERKDQSLPPLEENWESEAILSLYRPDLAQLAPLNLTSKGVNDRPFTQSEEKQPEENKIQKWFSGRFNLSAQAAPDLSGVKLNQLGKTGQALGIGAEYFISPQFSVNSGVFYSHKPYQSDGPFQIGYGEQITEVIGDCGILDIPVNLRFYPLQGAVQRAFVSIGLSSYLMLSETYEITYKDPATGYNYTTTLEKSGENQHPFGVVNLSLGYERKLANRLSLQVEPYFKVPIDGVGEGNISLKSTGIFLGLKYYPGR